MDRATDDTGTRGEVYRRIERRLAAGDPVVLDAANATELARRQAKAGDLRHGLTLETVELALGSGMPVWLSFRRCRHGVCGVYGQHWGGPEGDLFGRAARRFEELGIAALLINCLPPQHLQGMLPWLRDFT